MQQQVRALPSKWLVLSSTMLGAFSAMFGFIAVPVALPTIANDFQVGLPAAQWVLTAYLVASAALFLASGSAGDIVGRLRLFALGYIIFIVGLGGVLVANDLVTLVLCRILQGVGTALLLVMSPAIATSALPPQERGRVIGALQLGGTLASGLGPILGGMLIASLGWRWIFYVNILPALAGLALCFRMRGMATTGGEKRAFDFKGAFLLAIFLSFLVSGVGHAQQEEWEPLHTLEHVLPLWGIALLSLVLFVRLARKTRYPLLPLSLFRNPDFASTNVANVILHGAMIMISVVMPFYLQGVLGYSPKQMGFLYAPMSITIGLMALPSGWLYDRHGSKILCASGMAVGVAVLLSYLALKADSSYGEVLPRLVLTGIAIGLFVAPNVSAILSAAPREYLGVASGMEQTTRQFGHSLGAVVSAAIFGLRFQASADGSQADLFMAGFHDVSLVSAVLMALGVFLVLLRKERTRLKRR